jgi:acyl carrier protein
MSDNETATRLRGIIVDYAGVAPEKITDEALLFDDLDLDSLDKVEIVMAAEEAFGCEISDDDCDKAKTFADLLRLVEASKF